MSQIKEKIYLLIANFWVMIVIGFGVMLYGSIFDFNGGPLGSTVDNQSLYVISGIIIFIIICHIFLAYRRGRISYLVIDMGLDYNRLAFIYRDRESNKFAWVINLWTFMIVAYIVGLILLFFNI